MNGNNARRPGMEQLEKRTLMAVTGLPLTLGNKAFDMGKRVVITPDGGFIEAGLFSGTVDFDPGAGTSRLTSKADSDIFIAKYNSSGAFQWVRQIGGNGMEDELLDQDKIVNVAADPRFGGGWYINGVSADPSLVGEYLNDIVVQADGSIILAGSFLEEVDFNPGAGKKIFTTYDDEYYDAFVLKLNASGNFVWADQFGDRFTDTANALAVDGTGNIYVTGLYSRTVDFVKGNAKFRRTAEGRADGYLMRLNSAGKVRWVNSFGGDATDKPFRDAGLDVALDGLGNVIVGGTFAAKADFDPTAQVHELIGEDDTDGFVAKYGVGGAYINAVAYLGRGFDGITNVAVDSANNIIVTGYFQGEDFDANPGGGTALLNATPEEPGDSPDFTDIFVEKLNKNLQMQWVQQIAGTGYEFVDQIKIDSADNIVLGGSFYGLAAKFGTATPIGSTLGADDFDRDINDGDRDFSYDAFLWKLGTNGTSAWVRKIGGVNDDFGAGIDIASDNSILLTGRYSGIVDFDTTGGALKRKGQGFGDAFVTQFDQNGSPLF